MTLEAFQNTQHAIADATGMAHAAVDRFLLSHRIQRDAILRVPGFHVLPTIIANSDLLAVIPARLAETFAAVTSLLSCVEKAYETKEEN